MTARWPSTVDQILDRDHVAMLGYVTPARGVVLLPLTNFGIRDRKAGTVTVNSSVGMWKKLEAIRRNPRVALAFHTREHALEDRPEYVLVQGPAAFLPPVPDYPTSILENWERVERWRDLSPLWKWWLRVYALRVPIEITVERLIVWPDLACRGAPEVTGRHLPPEPPKSQQPTARGTSPRINHLRAATRATRLPYVLLGWVGADGFPVMVPVRIAGTEERGIVLDVAEGLVPPGGRRAGLTAHWFSRGVVGQDQRKYTGWHEAESGGRRVVYAPHTKAGYRFPASTLLYRLMAGLATRWGLRGARAAGFVPQPMLRQAVNDEYRRYLAERHAGEVAGEELFRSLAAHTVEPDRKYKWTVLEQLERETKERLRRAMQKLAIEPVDDPARVQESRRQGERFSRVAWLDFMKGFRTELAGFVSRFEKAEQLAPSGSEDRRLLEEITNHERALLEFADREFAGRSEQSLEPILAILHTPPPR